MDRKRFALLLLLPVVSALPATAQMQCNLEATNPFARLEGYTEPVGDIVMVCTGGAPTAASAVVPSATFTVNLNHRITNKITAADESNTTLFNDVLLMIDEPNIPNPVQHPVLNCGQTMAPDNGAQGPGVCGIIGTGDPASTYDGSPGHPNVFQGRVVSGTDFTQIQFVGVPVDPPGTGLRVFRITNLRANADDATGCPAPSCSLLAQVSVTLPGSADPFTGSVSAGFIRPGLVSQVIGPNAAPTKATLRITEGFPTSWRPRNVSFLVGDHAGISGNGPAGNFNGETNYPGDIAQNVSNTFYSTEGGFQWQNDLLNGPPSPNPPAGLSLSNFVVADLGNPLDSAAAGGLNTGINSAGTVNAGTRVALNFSNLPPAYSLQVPAVIYLHMPGDATTKYGVMVLTQTDASGAGPYSPAAADKSGASVVNGGMAVYEVLYSQPFAILYADVPCTLTHLAGSYGPELKTDVTVTVSLAPFFAAGNGANQPTPNPQFAVPASVPRFRPGTPAVLFQLKGKP